MTSVWPPDGKLAMLPARRPSQITALKVMSGKPSHPGHVRVEGMPVIRVLSGERGHLDTLRVTHLLEQGAQIPVLHWAQRHKHHVLTSRPLRTPVSSWSSTNRAARKANTPSAA